MTTVFEWKDDEEHTILRVDGNPDTQRYLALRPGHEGRWISFATIDGDEALEHFKQACRLTDRAGHTRGWKSSRAKAIQDFKNHVENLA